MKRRNTDMRWPRWRGEWLMGLINEWLMGLVVDEWLMINGFEDEKF